MLKWIVKEYGECTWTGLVWPLQGAGLCECGDEPSGFIKRVEFLDYMRNHRRLKKNTAS